MFLNGQTVIVVGGGSGIGRAVAGAASEAGARVVVAGRRAEALAATAAAIPGPAGAEVLDGADEGQVAAFFDRVGPFHHLVCTASQGAAGPVTALEAPTVAQAFATKLWAPSSSRNTAGRVGRVEEQAQAVLHCLANPFPTGTVLSVDGGAHLV